MKTFDNYPVGAADDPWAPYNEPVELEETLKFELNVKGRFFPTYYDREELEKKTEKFRKDLENLLDKYEISSDEEYIVDNIFAEVW